LIGQVLGDDDRLKIIRFARAISAAAFGLHLMAGAASVALMLTRKFDRLI
jgi:hypothetical protein